VDALVGRGDQALVLDDLSTGQGENLAHLDGSSSLELVEGSVLDEDLVLECMRSVDACVHMASAVGVQLIVGRPVDSLLRNVRGNDIVISSAAALGRKLLFASTSEIYGKNTNGALSEDSDRHLGPITTSRWGYATAKAFGEALAYGYHRELGADSVVVRLFNTVGPRQTGAYGMVLPRFVRQALTGEDLTVYGDGTQTRCFGHVRDTVRAMVLLLDAELARGRVFNIGSSLEVSILELARRVIDRSESTSDIRFVPYEDAYAPGFEELGRRKPDTAALEQLTGWRSELTLDDAIDDVVAAELTASIASRRLRVAG
jgi:UDP-glucose 4-epimerase